MPKFLTYSDLRSIDAKSVLNEASVLGRAESKYGKNTFLSHSSKDKKYLAAVITLLEEHGASVYVDDGDRRLPTPPSKVTAQVLRDTIRQLNRFIVFVTPNSKDSRWIPWELGLADGFKTPDNVAILPATESATDQQWANQEYLGLYSRIVWGQIKGSEACWIVWDHQENTALTLRKWITGY